ncbi:MAG: DUF2784 family protein [Armatimonadota bacterium]|nr:DUF2784 domain-containing protein [bacterium]MDW8320201.1 DUF2784 family protein [Armatimonadota bacterium]
MVLWWWLANIVVMVHALFVLGFVVGTLLLFVGQLQRWRRLEITFWILMLAGWGLFVVLQDCPLTLLENTLRAKVNPGATYNEGCISHYARRLGITISDRLVNRSALALLFLALAGSLFWHLSACVIRRRRR